MASSGMTLSTVVTVCTQPEALMPYQLTNVNAHKKNKVTAAEAPGTVAIHGNNGDK
jgi:hypothetical protein